MSPRDRRALQLGAAILAPALLYSWVAKPYQAALDDARQRLRVERETLVRERAAVAAARKNPLLQHVADSAMKATTTRLFAGRDDVMASAELASYLGEVARQQHVWLQDASTRPAVLLAGGVRALKVDLRAESDLQGVLSLLRALETGSKIIRVDRLDISRQPNRLEGEGPETLAISATVSGYAIPVEPSAPAPAGKSDPARRGTP